MTDARTDFLDARLRLAHELASEGTTPEALVAALSTSLAEALFLLATFPGEPLEGSSRQALIVAEDRIDELERQLAGTEKRLAQSASDQLAMVAELDRVAQRFLPARRTSRSITLRPASRL